MGDERHASRDARTTVRSATSCADVGADPRAVMTSPSPGEALQKRMLAGQATSVQRLPPDTGTTSRLSGLTLNENLLLGSMGWEAVDLCSGAAVWGMRRDTINTWGSDQDARASLAFGAAMRAAVDRLEASCRTSGGHGVI